MDKKPYVIVVKHPDSSSTKVYVIPSESEEAAKKRASDIFLDEYGRKPDLNVSEKERSETLRKLKENGLVDFKDGVPMFKKGEE